MNRVPNIFSPVLFVSRWAQRTWNNHPDNPVVATVNNLFGQIAHQVENLRALPERTYIRCSTALSRCANTGSARGGEIVRASTAFFSDRITSARGRIVDCYSSQQARWIAHIFNSLHQHPETPAYVTSTIAATFLVVNIGPSIASALTFLTINQLALAATIKFGSHVTTPILALTNLCSPISVAPTFTTALTTFFVARKWVVPIVVRSDFWNQEVITSIYYPGGVRFIDDVSQIAKFQLSQIRLTNPPDGNYPIAMRYCRDLWTQTRQGRYLPLDALQQKLQEIEATVTASIQESFATSLEQLIHAIPGNDPALRESLEDINLLIGREIDRQVARQAFSLRTQLQQRSGLHFLQEDPPDDPAYVDDGIHAQSWPQFGRNIHQRLTQALTASIQQSLNEQRALFESTELGQALLNSDLRDAYQSFANDFIHVIVQTAGRQAHQRLPFSAGGPLPLAAPPHVEIVEEEQEAAPALLPQPQQAIPQDPMVAPNQTPSTFRNLASSLFRGRYRPSETDAMRRKNEIIQNYEFIGIASLASIIATGIIALYLQNIPSLALFCTNAVLGHLLITYCSGIKDSIEQDSIISFIYHTLIKIPDQKMSDILLKNVFSLNYIFNQPIFEKPIRKCFGRLLAKIQNSQSGEIDNAEILKILQNRDMILKSGMGATILLFVINLVCYLLRQISFPTLFIVAVISQHIFSFLLNVQRLLVNPDFNNLGWSSVFVIKNGIHFSQSFSEASTPVSSVIRASRGIYPL